jgi:hypothetical protein
VTHVPVVAVALIWAGALFALAVLAAWHVWYALALSRVFAAHDTEPWRAWVPVLNEAELLRLGREDPVKAALFLVPLVNLYAIVLKAVAAARIGRAQERPAGLVALAVILPPLWATLLAAPRRPRPTAPAPAPAAVPAPPVAGAGARPATAAPLPAPAAALPPAPGPAAGASAPAPLPVAPAPVAPAPKVASAPAPATPSRATGASVDAAAASAEAADQPLTRRRAAALRRDGIDDATAVVRAPAGWDLLLPSGDTVPLTARAVVLGRNPQPEDDAQIVAVADTTRTVSKRHARLQWDGRAWTITDLDSTNGVTLTQPDGTELMLPPGTSVPVHERFTLGDAPLVLRRASA